MIANLLFFYIGASFGMAIAVLMSKTKITYALGLSIVDVFTAGAMGIT